jgi:hypothetical protein
MERDSMAQKRKHQANMLIENINHELKDQFQRSKGILLNPNTKGREYEQEISRDL